MKQMKKLLCGLLMVCMVLTGIGIMPQRVQAANDDFVIENGVLKEYKGAGGKVIIPNGVKEIADYVFYYNDTITSITVPNSVTKCGSRCFGGCTSLKEIIFKNSKTILDWDSLTQNYSLQEGAFYAGDYWLYSFDEVKPMTQTLTVKGYKGSTAEKVAKNYSKYPWGNLRVKFVDLKSKKTTIYGIPTSLTLKKGKTSSKCKPNFQYNENEEHLQVTYKSSNKKIATISSNGKVTAIKKGTTTITVIAGYSNWKKVAKVKVTVK